MSHGNPSDVPARSSARRAARRLCHRARHRLVAEHDRLDETMRGRLCQAELHLRQQNRKSSGQAELGQGIRELETVMAEAFPGRFDTPLRPAWEMLFVALIIALSARTFFVQPFSVPTGSMEPTLHGIHSVDLRDDPEFIMPSWPRRQWDRFARGTRHFDIVARSEGMLEEVRPPAWAHPFAQFRFRVGSSWYRVPASVVPFLERAGLQSEHYYQVGEPILRFRFTHGDFMIADRFSSNFRRPRRGEIVVFETHTLESLQAQHYYVKRLVALDGERVRIGNDRHLVVNDRRLDADTPGFGTIYRSPNPTAPEAYLGHLNAAVAAWIGLRNPDELAPLFPDETATYHVEPDHFLVLGDNTLFSLDSRVWGSLPITAIVGRAWLIYWPLSERAGWVGP
jgi:signal peptidase I